MQRTEVLRSAEDFVKRFGVAQCHFVELRHWEIGEVAPARALIEGLVEARVGSRYQVVAVVRVDPQGVVVAVFLSSRPEVVDVCPTVARNMEEHVHLIHEIGILW